MITRPRSPALFEAVCWLALLAGLSEVRGAAMLQWFQMKGRKTTQEKCRKSAEKA